MTAGFDETALRHWLVDYLVTNIGCSPGDISFEASLNDLGIGSRDAVVLASELAELLGRPVSPVEFWEHSTIADLAAFLAGGVADSDGAGVEPAGEHRDLRDEPIAVIGLGCRFPGDVAGPDAFWDFLLDEESAIGEVPPGRWDMFDDGSPEVAAALRDTTRWGGYLSGIDEFDAEFFEISPSEAAKMDPQQRLLLEVVHEAFEHAGIPAKALRHSQTSVFAGACLGEYGYLASSVLSDVDSWSGTGGALSIIANRVSYHYDLRGPSVTVDTACSSSLVAAHLACQSLARGESQLAIVAGVNVILSPTVTRSFDQAQAMSPTGSCHAFDAAADGFVRSEGCGVLVLKRLSEAQRDGDRVLAVIRGSAVSQDGRSNGLMAPNPAAQMAVLRSAYANSGVPARDVDYVEAHGTGTLLGDPIEARALGAVLGRARAHSAPLLIGSVKSNLGHLEAAAGVAGLIKTVLALHHGKIPGNLNFHTPNPHIPFQKLGLQVVAAQTDWPSNGHPRRAGVSSFGFGGTNAHVVLEQVADAPQPAAPDQPASAVTTLVVSGKTHSRIASAAGLLADHLARGSATLAEVAHTLNHHRDRHPKFATVAARDREQAIAGLQTLARGQAAPGVVPAHQGVCREGTVFVYSGQGSQWVGMGRQLLAEEPAFAAAIACLEPAFVEHVGFSLATVLTEGRAVTGIANIQPVLVGMQLALTELWRSYGVHPDAVIGHSMGEVTAAVVAGALTPAEGLRVIATRSRLMSRLSGQGAMALIELSPAAAQTLVSSQPDVTVAVYASPRQTVIAGAPEQVDVLMATVHSQGLLARRVDVDVASHHRTIDPILPELRTALADLAPKAPTIPVFSTTETGGGDMPPRFDAQYWVDNLRNPVQFARAVTAAGAEHGHFVEVSPHPLLTYAISDTLADVHHHAIGTLDRDTPDTLTFHTNLNSTHTVHPPDTEHPPGPHVHIPPTPWQHRSYWMAAKKRQTPGMAPRPGTLLGGHTELSVPPVHLWQCLLTPQAKPYSGFHRLQGVEVVPLSVLLATMATAAAHLGDAGLSAVRIEQPVLLEQSRLIQVVADGDSLSLASSVDDGAGSARWVRHVSAKRSAARPAAQIPSAADHVAASPGDLEAVEQLVAGWGVEGKPYEWSIQELALTAEEVTARIELDEPTIVGLLDAAVHAARLVDRTNPRLLVPSAVENIWLTGQFRESGGTAVARRSGGPTGELIVDITVTDSAGNPCAELRGLRYADIEAMPARRAAADPASIAQTIDWQPWVTPSGQGERGRVAVLGGTGVQRSRLHDGLARLGCPPVALDAARHVIYLSGDQDTETDIDAAVRLSTAVGDVVRQLADRDAGHPATLWLVTQGVHDAADDAALPQSCLWGLAGVIAAEQPQIWGGLLDIAAADDLDTDALTTLLAPSGVTTLVRRDGRFLAPTLVPLSGTAVREAARCRTDAAYLITGGLGTLGLLMADWLADRGARRLILAGRTTLPPRRDWDGTDDATARRRIAAIRALEQRGVAVEIAAVDVASAGALRQLVDRRDHDGAPPVRGVIHAAGVTGDHLVTGMSDATVRPVLAPKIGGAQALHDLFPSGQLDFLFLTASAGSVFGVAGQGAYAAANAYLDCLARARHRQGCHTVSLDWVAWEGLGFGADAAVVSEELQRQGSRPLTAEEAFRAWEYVDRYDVAQAVLAPTAGAAADRPESVAPDWSGMSAGERTDRLRDSLRAILARELQLPDDDLVADRPFAELGLNSLTAMSIRREAEALVGQPLSVTMLWNHPTIAELGSYLAELLGPPQASDDEAAAASPVVSVLDSLLDSAESSHA